MKIQELINHDIICSCGRTHRCNIEYLLIGKDALSGLPSAVSGYNHIIVVADNNTYPICGDSVCELLGTKMEWLCIFRQEGHLIPNEESIEKLDSSVSEQTDLILGIGSGVLNDLCKYVSFRHNICCGIIATAPSMDGYASSGAAMILRGMKVTVTTHAPDIIIGDVGILKNAPMEMIRSGYADIIGKYSALCDWRLSALVNGEYLCPEVYRAVMDATNEVRGFAEMLNRRDANAIGRLTEILVLIGICLTLLSTTRPGSGSEHHLSHYFEITGLIEKKPHFLHGTDVGYSTVVTAGLREQICKLNTPEFQDPVDESLRMACYRKIYREYATEVFKLQQQSSGYRTDRRERYRSHWNEIREILSECPSAEQIQEMLTDAGMCPEEFVLMYGETKIQNGIWFAKDLKDRYSVLWLYDELFFGEKEASVVL